MKIKITSNSYWCNEIVNRVVEAHDTGLYYLVLGSELIRVGAKERFFDREFKYFIGYEQAIPVKTTVKEDKKMNKEVTVIITKTTFVGMDKVLGKEITGTRLFNNAIEVTTEELVRNGATPSSFTGTDKWLFLKGVDQYTIIKKKQVLKVGSKVRFNRSADCRFFHLECPDCFPAPDTRGTIVGIGTRNSVLVQWTKGSTSANDKWWCATDQIRVVND